MVTFSEIALNVGIVLGFASGLISLSSNDSVKWRIMLAIGMILPAIMILLICKQFLPESPRWLVSKNRPNEAHAILQSIYPPGFNTDRIINDIYESIEREAMAERGIGWNVIFHPTPAIRRMLIVGVGTAIAQQAVGIDAIQYYLVDVLEQIGIQSDTYQSSLILILLGTFKLVMIFIGGHFFDRNGRRPLLFLSLLGMFVALISISIAFLIDTASLSYATSIIVMIGLAVYLSFFSIGMGPGAWLIPSEVFSMSIRGKAMSVATLCNRITATLMSTTFLTTVSIIGWSGFFMLLSLVCIIIFLFLYRYLPETNGQSLENMSMYFAEITGDSSILEAEAQINHNQFKGIQQQSFDKKSSKIESNDQINQNIFEDAREVELQTHKNANLLQQNQHINCEFI
jgi:MFS family permease